MKNYAEELAYWYFRFNGFFLINNYVAHPNDRLHLQEDYPHQANSHSDTDLLGIRTPNVNEMVGYRNHHCGFLDELIPAPFIPNEVEYIGLICEVKAGRLAVINNNNLPNQIRRLGLFENIGEICDHLQLNNTYQNDGKAIVKIVVKRSPNIIQSWNTITIQQVNNFIMERFALYIDKHGGWDKFDSSLMQFLLKQQNNG